MKTELVHLYFKKFQDFQTTGNWILVLNLFKLHNNLISAIEGTKVKLCRKHTVYFILLLEALI